MALHNLSEMRRMYDDLLAKYHELRRTHDAPRVANPKMTLPPAPPEEVAVAEAERSAVEAMVKDFVRNGLSPEQAEAEARRIATSFASSAPAPLY